MAEQHNCFSANSLSLNDDLDSFDQKAEQNTPYPEQAVMVFSSRSGGLFFTLHDVSMTDAGPQIGPGTVMDKQIAYQFAQYVAQNEVGDETLLPANILMNSPTRLIWFKEPEVRKMWFKVGKKKVSYAVPWPRLLYVATPDELSVFAIKGRRRPSADTRLYHAPLMNIYDDGRVCLGSARMPARFDLSSIPDMEAIITDTLFSHTNHHYTLKKRGKGEVSNTEHIQFWRNLHKNKESKFPNTALRDTGTTLGGVLDEAHTRF